MRRGEKKAIQLKSKQNFICRWQDHLYRKVNEIYKKKSLELISEFDKVAGYEISTRKIYCIAIYMSDFFAFLAQFSCL